MTRGVGAGGGQRVCIIGGGITGLSAAYYLLRLAEARQKSLQLVILEADHRLGGKIRTARNKDLILELGPDSMLRRKPWALDLVRQIGLGDEIVGNDPRAGQMYAYHQGKIYPLPVGLLPGAATDPRQLLRSPLLSWPGKLRVLLEPFLPARMDDQDETIASFARRRLGVEAGKRMLEPLLKAPFGGAASRLSLLATYPDLRRLERSHGSLSQAVRGMAGVARAAADPAQRPSAFASLRSGLEKLVHALAGTLQQSPVCTIVTGTAVTAVNPGSRSRYRVIAGSASEEFDAVIITAPAFAAANIIRPVVPEVVEPLLAIDYESIGVVGFAFRRSSVSHSLDGSGIIIPEDSPLTMTGCAWLSSKWPHSCPADLALIRCFFKPRAGVSPDDLVHVVYEEMASLLGIKDPPIWTRFIHWPNAIPQYNLGHLERVERIEAALSQFPGLFLTGAALRGIGLPDCVRQGREAAEQAATFLFSNSHKAR